MEPQKGALTVEAEKLARRLARGIQQAIANDEPKRASRIAMIRRRAWNRYERRIEAKV